MGKERAALAGVAAKSDIVILAALVPGKEAPILMTEEMVQAMNPGSIIVDISIDQGGNCALTQTGQQIEYEGVLIDGTQNIPGTMPTSSTAMFAKNVLRFVGNLVQNGEIVLNLEDEVIRDTLVTKDGQIVHSGTLEAMELRGEE